MLCRCINDQKLQNVSLIWLDNNIDENNEDCHNTITQLERVANTINTFTDGDRCIDFIDTITDNKTCIIISGALGKHIVPHVHNMCQVDSIFIFCGNKKRHEQWAKEWSKIKGVFTDVLPICKALKIAPPQQCQCKVTSSNFVTTKGDAKNKNVDQLDPSFMYIQLLKEILLIINLEEQYIEEIIDYYHELYNFKQLEAKYHHETPFWWYTCDCSLYPMLSLALRLMDMDIFIQTGLFIDNLYRHAQQLYLKQFNGYHSSETSTIYRGQGLSKEDFEQITKTKGGLIPFNSFLSTSKNRDISLNFTHQIETDLNLLRLKIGHSDKTHEVYQITLDQTTNEIKRGFIYYQIGLVKYDQRQHPETITLYEKAIDIYQKPLPPNHSNSIVSYIGIGNAYYRIDITR